MLGVEYVRRWHCHRGVAAFLLEALRRLMWLLDRVGALAVGGKPGQRHRHSPSFTKGRGGIGVGEVTFLDFRDVNLGIRVHCARASSRIFVGPILGVQLQVCVNYVSNQI